MAKFDVYLNPNPDTRKPIPYLLDVQAELLDALQQRGLGLGALLRGLSLLLGDLRLLLPGLGGLLLRGGELFGSQSIACLDHGRAPGRQGLGLAQVAVGAREAALIEVAIDQAHVAIGDRFDAAERRPMLRLKGEDLAILLVGVLPGR